MADLDKQKEIVTFFRTAFFFLLSLIVALTGYIFNSYSKLSNIELIILNLVELLLLILLIGAGIALKKSIDSLKDL